MAFESNIVMRTVYGHTDAQPVAPKGYGSGFVANNGDKPLSSAEYRGKVYPRKDWDELARLQELNHTSPLHAHKGRVGIMNQRSTNYCWCFGTVAGVATQYAKTGITPVPKFSAASTACQIKNFANEGGWGDEAVAGIREYGIATLDTWPNVSFDRSLPKSPKVRADSFLHNVVDFSDLGRDCFDVMISSLLDPISPAPCTGGYSWWGHLVLCLQAVKVDGDWGVVIANSWGTNWGNDGGYGILLGSKARPTESIRISSVKPRSE